MFTIIEILEDGRRAPSAGNGQKWEFIAVAEPELVEKMSQGLSLCRSENWGMLCT